MDENRLIRIAEKVAASDKLTRDLQWWQDNCHPPSSEEAPKYWREDIPNKVYSEIVNDKHSKTIKWSNPRLEDNLSKFQRSAQSLGLDMSDLQERFARGFQTSLHPTTWSVLGNSDSWTIESSAEAEMWAHLRDESLQPFLDGIASGNSIPSPIILDMGDGSYHLVSGDSQLIIAKVMNEEPKVFVIEMSTANYRSDIAEMAVTGRRDR